jgi:hypothetical protein
MSEDLRQKIIDIICKEEWPTPEMDIPALGSDIYERLRRQGINLTDHALNDELAELWRRAGGDNPYAGGARRHTRLWARAGGGGATIHDVEDDLCEKAQRKQPLFTHLPRGMDFPEVRVVPTST